MEGPVDVVGRARSGRCPGRRTRSGARRRWYSSRTSRPAEGREEEKPEERRRRQAGDEVARTARCRRAGMPPKKRARSRQDGGVGSGSFRSRLLEDEDHHRKRDPEDAERRPLLRDAVPAFHRSSPPDRTRMSTSSPSSRHGWKSEEADLDPTLRPAHLGGEDEHGGRAETRSRRRTAGQRTRR